MPLRLEIKKKLNSRSDRVKCVDLHPTEPWVLSALFNGNVLLLDYNSGALVKSFEVCDLPVRSAKFIVRKQWFICAADDMRLRVYNYNTMEKVKEWESHNDYVRYIEVHPALPYVFSSSDDMSIRLWNWDKNWDCQQVFEGHSHYVMMVKVNGKDTNTFASASLDRSIKVWSLGSEIPNFSLDGHERGVNCIDYYQGGDKPYLLSGADDATVKIWDYQTRSCVQTLEGHTNNVCAVTFHPRLPLIVSGSEDGTVRIWHATTYRAENTLNYGLERAWSLSCLKDSNKLAIGYDEGTVVIKLGHETPIASMDSHTGKVVWAKNNDIQTTSVRGLAQQDQAQDGEALLVAPRDLGSCEIFPQSLKHNCNGRFIVVCGDGEYIIYTSQALRNKSFGQALDFVWSSSSTGDYAIRESISRVKIFKNFQEHRTVKLPVSSAEMLFGGQCLGVKSADCVVFFDWEEGEFVHKIDVVPKDVYWNEAGDECILACEEVYYVLSYSRERVTTAIQAGALSPEVGVEDAFELLQEMNDRVRTGRWVGECFLYTTTKNRLNYYVGGQIITLCHLDRTMYMLGYLPRDDRVFLVDKHLQVTSYRLLLAVLQYQTAVVRQDFETANGLLPKIPQSEYGAVARFLDSQGFKEAALTVSQDPDQRFDLAVELDKLEIATEILKNTPLDQQDTTDCQTRWKRLGDLALAKGDLALFEECSFHSADFGGLLLVYASAGNRHGMEKLLERAIAAGSVNVGFTTAFLLGKVEDCLELLLTSHRLPEAALFARTYLPSEISRVLALWREDLKETSHSAAKALADPLEYPNLFPDYDWALKVEALFKQNRSRVVPSNAYPKAQADLDLDLIAFVKAQAEGGGGDGGGEGMGLGMEVALPEPPAMEAEDVTPPTPPEAQFEAEPVAATEPEPVMAEVEPEAEPVGAGGVGTDEIPVASGEMEIKGDYGGETGPAAAEPAAVEVEPEAEVFEEEPDEFADMAKPSANRTTSSGSGTGSGDFSGAGADASGVGADVSGGGDATGGLEGEDDGLDDVDEMLKDVDVSGSGGDDSGADADAGVNGGGDNDDGLLDGDDW